MTSHRIALLGAGAWGLNHLRVLCSEPRCEVVGIVDPSPGARERAAKIAGRIPSAAVAGDLIASADAVLIATPARTHADLACAVLAAGKHVLIEKPFALSLHDARRIERAAAAAGKVVLVGHLMVYHPAVERLRTLLESGELGQLHYVHSIRENLGRVRQDENALWSFGPHELSMLDYLIGDVPVSVTARGQRVIQPGIEDVVFLTVRYRSGAMAHLHLSWLHPRKERRFTVVCSQRMVEFDDVAPEKLRIYDKGYDRPPEFTQFAEYLTLRDGDVFVPQLPMEEPLKRQLDHFLSCLDGTAEPRTGLASAWRVTQALEAAQRSLDQDGVPITISG